MSYYKQPQAKRVYFCENQRHPGKSGLNVPMEKALTPTQCRLMRTFLRMAVIHANNTDHMDIAQLIREFRIARKGSMSGGVPKWKRKPIVSL
jgi:hypothetical protein